ncbi:hypothetical protein M413DRAFT_355777 [Hebeloma cylindrosporum]|uniref:SAM domain-containing protein n=1 Tax=Hebeloma cylindrosporum TaxID=76867 RepID=A0A0C3CL82_HEBCY|nr:hypothetical protein M413DRAFT_355777 [Hebeloma cylindrosporum h7]
MDPHAPDKHLLDWDESDVHQWLSSLGFPQYESQLREHKIRGDSLCQLDAEGLKAMGVLTVGQRLSILKSAYHLKLTHEIPITEDDYKPPSEGATKDISIEDLHSSVKEQAQRLRSLEEDNRAINNAVRSFSEEIIKLRQSLGLSGESKIRRQLPYLRSDMEAIGRSALGPTNEDTLRRSPSQETASESPAASAYATPTSSSHDSSDNAKVTLDDPTWKVLPAALKKHRINHDEWPNYAMLISFGPPGNRTKRRLEMNEKPLYLFKKLKDAKKNPAFVLKNMKDLRSPLTDGTEDNSAAPHPSSGVSQGIPSPETPSRHPTHLTPPSNAAR